MEAWQTQLVTKNLDDLIDTTSCNVALLTKLKAAGVLSKADLQDVQQQRLTDLEKSHKLYEILLKKHGSFNILLEALHETQQSGAWQILNNKSSNYKFYGAIAYDKTAIIGRGCYNTVVFQGLFGGRKVAVKVVYLGLEIPRTEFSLQEVEFMKQLDDHENVVRYYFAEEKDDSICIAMELCCTNIQDWVLNKSVQIDKKEICLQATKGLAHIHSHNIIHRDLKPANILLSSRPLVKIADFGISKRIPWESAGVTAHSSGLGTEGWMAPEVLDIALSGHGQKLSTASDMFSLGCIYYFVFTDGLHPFGHPFRRQGNILDNKLEFPENVPELVPSEYLNLVTELIVPDPMFRPTAIAILNRLLVKESDIPIRKLMPAETSNLDDVVISSDPSIKTHTNITEQSWGMEPHEAEYIVENIFKLVMCTTVNSRILVELVKIGTISDEEKQEIIALRSQARSLMLYRLLLTRKGSYNTLQKPLDKDKQSEALQILAKIGDRKNEQESERQGPEFLVENIVKNIYSGEMEYRISQAETITNEHIKSFHADVSEKIKLLSLETKLVDSHEWSSVDKYLGDVFFTIYNHIPTKNPTILAGTMPTIGIDLGTKKCVVGLYIDNDVKTLEFESQTKSSDYMAFGDGNKFNIKGKVKLNTQLARNEYETEIFRETQNFSLASDLVFSGTLDPTQFKPAVDSQGSKYIPEDIFAIHLKHCKQEAEKLIGHKVTKAVITVSPYITNELRQALLAAAERVGLDVIQLLNYPIAAAIAYRQALIRPKISKILVVDVGGAKFDTAVVEFRDYVMEVKSYGGDAKLGGEDIDIILGNYCLENFWRKSMNSFQSKSPNYGFRKLVLLKESCERVKIEMSSHIYATDISSVSISNFHNGKDLFVTISLSKFEELISPLIEKMMKIVQDTLKKAHTSVKEIDDILLVGGTTCIRNIRREISKIFSQEQLRHVINPNIAVAYGATIRALTLSCESNEMPFGLYNIQDVFPISLSVAFYSSYGFEKFIKSNTRYPYEKKVSFDACLLTTTEKFKIWEYDESTRRCTKVLGVFKLCGLPRTLSITRKLTITIELDHLGCLNVRAFCSYGIPLRVKNVTKSLRKSKK